MQKHAEHLRADVVGAVLQEFGNLVHALDAHVAAAVLATDLREGLDDEVRLPIVIRGGERHDAA